MTDACLPDRRSSLLPVRATLLAAAMLLPATGRAQAPSVGSLTTAGHLTFCSAITQPPFESMSAASKPEGLDVDLGEDIAQRLGLQASWNNIPFSGLIPALQAGQCDAILSDLFVKDERRRVLDFVEYMYSQEVLLLKSDKAGISSLEDLSGKKAATVTGTTATQLLEAASAKLVTAGKPGITIVMFPENTQALQQLQFGQVDAFGVAYEIAEYYMSKAQGTFKLGGPAYFKILTGIGVRKDGTKLREAMQAAVDAMRRDGSYTKLLAKYDLSDDALPNS